MKEKNGTPYVSLIADEDQYMVSDTTSCTYKKVVIDSSEVDKESIEANKKFNVFVVSLPRSGSSMMTGIVNALGVRIVRTSDTEEKVKKREEEELKRYGVGGYQMNPDGFYEITENFLSRYIKVLATPFGGCKLIIPLGRFQRDLMTFNPCTKVIQMWRDPEEMRQSQQASYKGGLPCGEEDAETERAKIRTKLAASKAWLEEQGIETLHVQYRNVVNYPEQCVRVIAEFLGVTDEEKIKAATATIKPSRTRFKAEELTESI